ncbi:MAG TPA: hypothetical protein VN982_12745 [Candidatus Dormibacteraeota bacterium]|nr:hypothetical protein [Candidatus Dormibacteraeota bacterium]
MLGKKRSDNACREALVLEARAGLIPESDFIVEEVRVREARTSRIGRVIKAHARVLAQGSEALAIADILADLRHYCDGKGLSFDELDATACENYQEEEFQSHMLDSLPK